MCLSRVPATYSEKSCTCRENRRIFFTGKTSSPRSLLNKQVSLSDSRLEKDRLEWKKPIALYDFYFSPLINLLIIFKQRCLFCWHIYTLFSFDIEETIRLISRPYQQIHDPSRYNKRLCWTFIFSKCKTNKIHSTAYFVEAKAPAKFIAPNASRLYQRVDACGMIFEI